MIYRKQEERISKGRPLPHTTLLKPDQKPTNCDELKLMGHTLNGFYLVQRKQDNIYLKGKMETVYCDFISFSELIQPSNTNTAGKIFCLQKKSVY